MDSRIIWVVLLAFFSAPWLAAAETAAVADPAGVPSPTQAATAKPEVKAIPVAAAADVSAEELLVADESTSQDEVSDPLEPLNRAVFVFNDLVYSVVVRPVALVYSAVTPEPFRTGVHNFFHNLALPTHFVNAVLQNKPDEAGNELYRFAINTTVGVLGFYDAADHLFHLKPGNRDSGQTLGVYGVGDQVYLSLPILGPSNLRDSVGLVGDALLDPFTYVPNDIWTRAGIDAFRYENETSLRMEEYESLKKAALDPYIAVRNAYLQTRRKQIKE
ncbi:MAG: VacJ family lipoprotein [Magnetococcales bacterium]|nr:VacJ family lipoprotein [Magnetococcales bacterium]